MASHARYYDGETALVHEVSVRPTTAELWLYGAPDGAAIHQPTDRGPPFGEGLLDMFDVSGI